MATITTGIESPQKTYTISPSGGDFQTIQAALDAHPTADTMFIVYPGTYTDDTINFTANNQYVIGAQSAAPKVVLIEKASTICDFGAFTGGVIKNIKMVMTLVSTTPYFTVTGTGSCNFKFCHTECKTSQDITGDGCGCYYSTGTIKIVKGSIVYNHTGTRGGSGKKAVLVGTGSDFTIDDVTFTVTGSGTSSSMSAVRNNLAGTVRVDKCDINVTDAGATACYGIATIGGSGKDEIFYNEMHISNTGSGHKAIGLYADGSATGLEYRSMFNHIHTEAGGGGGATAQAFVVNNSDTTLISQFDDIISDTDVTNNGTYTYVNSGSDGIFCTSGSCPSRIWTATTDATPDINADAYDVVTITALGAAITDVNMSGTPTNFQKLTFRILDDGTARAIAWGSDFEDNGAVLPTTTVISKLLTVGFIYDTVSSKWGCVAVANET